MGREDRAEQLLHTIDPPRRIDLLDLVTERAQQLGRVGDRLRAERIDDGLGDRRQCVVAAIRSLPGGRLALSAKGSGGGGAQLASPIS